MVLKNLSSQSLMVKSWVVGLVVALLGAPTVGWGAMRIKGLRCEYQTNPIGIDAPSPRLSWLLESDKRGEAQTAYHVVASSGRDFKKADLWDSGRVEENLPFNVEYKGRPLQSGERAYWRVRAYGVDGKASGWSEPAYFERGLSAADWKGQWINDGKIDPTKDEDFYGNDPSPLFRKEFEAVKPVRRARLYVAGLGYYIASLNGHKIGDRVLEPGWTKFGTRVEYATYDVTESLKQGRNCLGMSLGNGWYDPLPLKLFGTFNLRKVLYIGRPRFIAQLEMEYEDGTESTIVSDPSWKVGESEVRFNNIYLGEVVDARKSSPGWDVVGFNDSAWRLPIVADEPIGKLQAAAQPPIRVTAHIPAVSISEPKPRVYIYDFGVEFAGWASIRFHEKRGTKVVLRYGELLHQDGSLNPMTSVAGQIKGPGTGGPGSPDIAWQSDTYICRGREGETYTPRFTFHGFRYMEITGVSKAPSISEVSGLRLNADVQSAGAFSCSNSRFNQIQEMCQRTFLANLFSVQSDCPHRERLGYGGDIVGTSEAFLMNYDMAGFYGKTVQDFGDAAQSDGLMTDTAPYIGIQYCGVGWAMAHPHLARELAEYYGDHQTTADQYETAARWLRAVEVKYPDGIVTDGLSDHESLEPTPAPVMVTPLYFKSAKLLAAMARDLGKSNEAEEFESLASKIAAVYKEKFFGVNGKIGIGSQGAQSFAIYSGLLTYSEELEAMNTLNTWNGHTRQLTTGLMGTKFLLDSLSRLGRVDDAYAIVDQPYFPGWGWMLKNGATTLWEHWALDDNTYSHCHPMFGSVSQWFYNWLGGIQQAPGSVGFEHLLIRPQFNNDLKWVHCEHTGMFGKIACNWKRDGYALQVQVEVPVGSNALVYLPFNHVLEGGREAREAPGVRYVKRDYGEEIYAVKSGHYSFDVDLRN